MKIYIFSCEILIFLRWFSKIKLTYLELLEYNKWPKSVPLKFVYGSKLLITFPSNHFQIII